ncbi:DUF1992 domain-containing protein [Pseudodesulfovibrio sp. JC047]|uniref:DnaJ family domain-containing protein n=1 Tax=Pseudodesulfovibrio sp. JC047 TaxID=2683199 RepID=UPI0013D57928|nr:DnaJ family domain-containing protein [Pseudodesulfovibrio sp. JC047]NDV20463.1 DUF1992 domain-containing protein [Pseudodesulfovibrio sp. JC047]
MFNFSQIMSEEHIKRAIKDGAFEHLAGQGKPLPKDDTENLPPELRMAYRVLKNSGYVPAEIAEEKEITRTIDLLATMKDEQERYRQIQKLNVMILKMNERRGRPIILDTSDEYYRRIVEKVRIAEERFDTTHKKQREHHA